MNDQKNQANQMAQGYSALLVAFIEANRKLAEELSCADSLGPGDVDALEILGKNAVVIRDLLYK